MTIKFGRQEFVRQESVRSVPGRVSCDTIIWERQEIVRQEFMRSVLGRISFVGDGIVSFFCTGWSEASSAPLIVLTF